MKTLILPLGENKITIAAIGNGAKKSLLRFAGLIKETTVNEVINHWDLLLTDKHIAPEENSYCVPEFADLPFIWNPPAGVMLKHNPQLPPWVSGEWQHMTILSVLNKLITPQPCFVIHGALLELSPGKGSILFGHSGVGKSTAALRCNMEKSIARCDDVILCTLYENALLASPLPTPSYCREYYTPDLCYSLRPQLEVKQLLHLKRSQQEERIVEISRDEWLSPLVHALTFHFLPYLKILPVTLRQKIGNIILDLALQLTEKFLWQQLETSWLGNIVKTLTAK